MKRLRSIKHEEEEEASYLQYLEDPHDAAPRRPIPSAVASDDRPHTRSHTNATLPTNTRSRTLREQSSSKQHRAGVSLAGPARRAEHPARGGNRRRLSASVEDGLSDSRPGSSISDFLRRDNDTIGKNKNALIMLNFHRHPIEDEESLQGLLPIDRVAAHASLLEACNVGLYLALIFG
jgi:hypothetical protein